MMKVRNYFIIYDYSLLLCHPVKSVHTAFLLATCYYRSGRTQQARHLLIGHKMSPQCQLLYARCCLDLKE